MTVLVDENLEDNNIGYSGGSGGTVVTTPTPAHGTYCLKQLMGSGYWSFTGLTELYCRFYFQWNGATVGGAVLRYGNGTTILGRLYFTPSSKKLSFLRGSTLVATGSHTLNADAWYLVEVRYVLDQSAGTFHVKVDGADDITFTGDTNASTPSTIDRFYIEKTTTGGTFYYDDIKVNDTGWIGGVQEVVEVNGNGQNFALSYSESEFETIENPGSGNPYSYSNNTYAGNIDIYSEAQDTIFSSNRFYGSTPTIGRTFGPSIQSG